MFKRLGRLWRLLTTPIVPPEPLLAQTVTLEFICQVCGQSFQQEVRQLFMDVAESRRWMGQQRTTLAPGEVFIPEPIGCPHCLAINQFDIAASAYLPLGAALLRARRGLYQPHQPIQFINILAQPAPLDPPAPPQDQPPRPKRRPPRKKADPGGKM